MRVCKCISEKNTDRIHGVDTDVSTFTYLHVRVHHKLVRIPRVEQPVHGPVTLKLHLYKMCSNMMESLSNRRRESVARWIRGRWAVLPGPLLFFSYLVTPFSSLFFLFAYFIRFVSSLSRDHVLIACGWVEIESRNVKEKWCTVVSCCHFFLPYDFLLVWVSWFYEIGCSLMFV